MTDSVTGPPLRRPPVADSTERVRVTTGAAPNGSFDHAKIVAGVRLLFEGLGLSPEDERIRDTPERVARMFDEVFAGLLVDPAELLDVVFEEGHDELVLIRDIPIASMCEHHLIPFVGRAHVGYLPNTQGQVTGLSKLARLVDVVARRPNLQERITTTVADIIEKALSPRGVLVIIEAEHYCMTMRGVRKPGAVTVTSAVRGMMRDDPRTRAEAMALAMGHRPLGFQ
ncbi:MAG TPA: GTP cyclohydrolase I FolE [Egibacteraceae bacterium]|nr:GTP cyclohydrolase I FolE [Egibacteraceae bacterium]